jgi:hypothetical protein
MSRPGGGPRKSVLNAQQPSAEIPPLMHAAPNTTQASFERVPEKTSFHLLEGETLFLSGGQPLVEIRDIFRHNHARPGVLHSLSATLLKPFGQCAKNVNADFVDVNVE